MTSDDTARLIYLVLLGGAILGWGLLQRREGMNKTLQHAAIWGFIFLGAVVAVGLWQDVQRSLNRDRVIHINTETIAVPRARDGHYYLTIGINDVPIRFVVDTGASDMVLTRFDADRVGINPAALNYVGVANTANGRVRTAPVMLDQVTLGGVTDTGVRAVVNEGQMNDSLLGMGYLERWGRIEIANGELILTR